MPAAVASLPIGAVTRRAPDTESSPEASMIRGWLDALRPGWAARFSLAFERLGITAVAQVKAMRAEEFEALEVELKEIGARLVHVKQLRKAAEALANSSKENNGAGVATPQATCACVDYYQSPMAAYFGEQECNLAITMHTESPLANVTNLEPNAWMRPSPKANLYGDHHDLSSKSCNESGLPFKSPMSAYFDGDEDWESIMSPESDIVAACSAQSLASNGSRTTESANAEASPADGCIAPSTASSCISSSPGSGCMAPPMMMQMVPACFVPCNAAMLPLHSQSFNLSTQAASPPCGLSCAPGSTKSALRTTPKNKERRVSWSEEMVEVREVVAKPSLCLQDLLSKPGSKPMPVAMCAWQLSRDAQGTFEVQKALDDCSNDEERAVLAAQLRGHVFEATQCPHANHVLRKVITMMPPSTLNFVIVELMAEGRSGIIELARHRFGCRILEGLLVQCPLEQLQSMVEILLAEAAALCTHMYGNFVMQRLLEHVEPDLCDQLLKVLHSNLVAMGTNFYGSTVLVKAMSHGRDTQKLTLAHAILDINGLSTAIAKYRHGKSIFELVLNVVGDAGKDVAMRQFHLPPLKAPKCGRTC